MQRLSAVLLLLAAAGSIPGGCGGDPELPRIDGPPPTGDSPPGPSTGLGVVAPIERIDVSVNSLASEDAAARMRAEAELVAAGPDAAPRLLERVSGAGPELLAAAPTVLKAMGSEVVPHLREALRDGDADRRVVAVMSLLLLGRDAAGAAGALSAARSDPDPRVRAAAEHAYRRAVGDTSELDRQRAEHDAALRRSREH